MVRNASRALKIGVHLPFDPNFDLGISTYYPEKFQQAYCTVVCEKKKVGRHVLSPLARRSDPYSSNEG